MHERSRFCHVPRTTAKYRLSRATIAARGRLPAVASDAQCPRGFAVGTRSAVHWSVFRTAGKCRRWLSGVCRCHTSRASSCCLTVFTRPLYSTAFHVYSVRMNTGKEITVRDAAAILQRSTSRVHQFIREKRLRSRLLTRRLIVIPEKDVLRLAAMPRLCGKPGHRSQRKSRKPVDKPI